MSLLMLLAFPNFLTASSPAELGLLTAAGARLGLVEFNLRKRIQMDQDHLTCCQRYYPMKMQTLRHSWQCFRSDPSFKCRPLALPINSSRFNNWKQSSPVPRQICLYSRERRSRLIWKNLCPSHCSPPPCQPLRSRQRTCPLLSLQTVAFWRC